MSARRPTPLRRSRKQRPRRFWSATVLSGAILVVLLLGGYGSLLIYSMLSPLSRNPNAPSVYVTIDPGSSVHAIGKLLVDRGVIRHTRGFQLAMIWEQIPPSSLHSGTYKLSPAMPPRQIADIIALGRTSIPPVMVPDGFTVSQIAARLSQLGLVDPAQFLAVARTGGRTFGIDGFTPPAGNVEGYLCPGTYTIGPGTSPHDIVSSMLAEFRSEELSRLGGELARRPDAARVMIVASLVEKEAKMPGDRPLIAAVLYNRLRRGMKLQCDATVEYALPAHKSRLFYKDLAVPSPYNTYLHAGLPPTPIASPGWASIDAALHPAHVDYLYYVARPDGSHIFTSSLAEHDKARRQVQALRAAAGQDEPGR